MKKVFLFFTILSLVAVFFAISVLAAEGAVAKVGEVEYGSLQEAIDGAGKGDTVVLLADLEFATDVATGEGKGYFNVSADDEITIDFNGKSINVTENCSGHFILFYNFGSLTVKNGTVSLTATVDRDWNAESAVFMNRGGIFTVESGSYEHKGGTDMAFALDNNGNSFGDAYAYVNGGRLASTYRAIRMRMADTTLNGEPGNGTVSLTVTGGEIYGTNSGIWGQITNPYSGELGDLGITGGTVGGGKTAITMGKDEYENIDVTISGDARIEGTISGEAKDFEISGGTFTAPIPDGFCKDGFSPVQNADGSFSIAVALEATFSFLGYSVNSDYSSIAVGYNIDQELLATWREQNGVEKFDFGCAFGINSISKSTLSSFAKYSNYQTFHAKIKGIDITNENHLTSSLALALYINRGNGIEYVVEIDNKIAIVDASSVPTVTMSSYVK